MSSGAVMSNLMPWRTDFPGAAGRKPYRTPTRIVSMNSFTIVITIIIILNITVIHDIIITIKLIITIVIIIIINIIITLLLLLIILIMEVDLAQPFQNMIMLERHRISFVKGAKYDF